jgi:nucleotide sugar dehydrogenase
LAGTIRKNGEILKVAVIGLGKIGLPLALAFAENNCLVHGVDISTKIVQDLNDAISHVDEPELPEKLSRSLASRTFKATSDLASAVGGTDYVVVAVPLFVDKDNRPDFEILDQVSGDIARHLQPGSTVIFETTLPVGSTRDRLTPILEAGSGLQVGKDFFVAYSPERISSGSAFKDLATYPKLVGGVDRESGSKAAQLYEQGLRFEDRLDLRRRNGVWLMANSETAEFAKLAETTFRDVNIALANTFARHAEEVGTSYEEVLEACNSQPFSLLHRPGVSVGGHCIPVYPHLYLTSDSQADLVRLARDVNKAQPDRALHLLEKRMGSLKGKKVLVSGLSYRTGVKESAYSGAWDIVSKVESAGGITYVVDELFTPDEVQSLGLRSGNLPSGYDCLIVNSGSRNFQLSLFQSLSPNAHILDGRGVLQETDHEALIRLGEGLPQSV